MLFDETLEYKKQWWNFQIGLILQQNQCLQKILDSVELTSTHIWISMVIVNLLSWVLPPESLYLLICDFFGIFRQ